MKGFDKVRMDDAQMPIIKNASALKKCCVTYENY